MKKQKMKSQKGFGLVPILLILILILLVGFVGYYVYNQQTSKKADKSEVTNAVTNKVTPTPTANTSATPAASPTPAPNTQKYLIIKEWGVKVPLSSGIEDAAYIINANGPAETEQSAWIYKKSYAAISSSCERYSLITRFSNQSAKTDWFGEMSTLGERYKNISYKIGNYYYAPQGPQSSCGTAVGNDPKNVNPPLAEQVKTTQEFAASLKNMVAN